MSADSRICVTGAGGFIGSHLVTFLKKMGHWVRGVDIKQPEYRSSAADEFEVLDLRDWANSLKGTRDIDEVYALAADMGGMGFISCNQAKILHNNLLIDLHTLEAARVNGVKRYLYASSACIYPEVKQCEPNVGSLKESDAYPAEPQCSYGWQKLTGERLCSDYHDDFGMETRVARLHNIFGPYGTWLGGREKAPAALCRKIAQAKLTRNPLVEIWGDGNQTRSFCYIDDCIEGIFRLMQSNYPGPLNIGQDQAITIDALVDKIALIAGIRVKKVHVQGAEGVRGRNSDNTLLLQVLNWKPQVDIDQGLKSTYPWIEEQVHLMLGRMSDPGKFHLRNSASQ